jgi:hypothetical protein
MPERCSGTDWIDMIANVHVKVSCAKGFGVAVENQIMCTDTTEKSQI